MSSPRIECWPVALFAAGLLCAALGCTSTTPPPASDKEQLAPATKLSPTGRKRMELRIEKRKEFQELNQATEENTVSPYRYVISTDRHSIFGSLVKASSHSRTIHGSGVTLLCPTDKAFDNFDNWKLLLDKDKKIDLDDFVAHHVLPTVMSYEALKSKTSHTTLSGDVFNLDTHGGVSINGAHVRSGHVSTLNGNVVGLDDVAYIPLTLQ